MIYTTIGLIVGMTMGLTGAGGALISIPLFINLLDTSLKDATVLSLVAVLFGTAINLFGQFSKVNIKIAMTLSAAGIVANYLSLSMKSGTPEIVIAALLTVIGIYSIVSVWGKNKTSSIVEKDSQVVTKALIAGAFSGLMTTLTGLGGGVILVPILIKFFGKNYKEALPTSLATILLISLSAFMFQSKVALGLIAIPQLLMIGGGAILAFLLLKVLLRKLSEVKVLQIRRIVFTLVTVYSVVSVIIKAM